MLRPLKLQAYNFQEHTYYAFKQYTAVNSVLNSFFLYDQENTLVEMAF